jgi:hypothetical protein
VSAWLEKLSWWSRALRVDYYFLMCVGRSLARRIMKGNDQSTKCLIESQDDWKQSTSSLKWAESQ